MTDGMLFGEFAPLGLCNHRIYTATSLTASELFFIHWHDLASLFREAEPCVFDNLFYLWMSLFYSQHIKTHGDFCPWPI